MAPNIVETFPRRKVAGLALPVARLPYRLRGMCAMIHKKIGPRGHRRWGVGLVAAALGVALLDFAIALGTLSTSLDSARCVDQGWVATGS